MSIAEKLQTIAENEQRVYDAGYAKGQAEGGDTSTAYDEGYEAGKQAEYDAFWDAYQQNGGSFNYTGAFCGLGWDDDTFKPKYDIRPVGVSASMMFYLSGVEGDLVEILASAGVTMDLSKAISINATFNSTKFTRVGVIDGSGVTSSSGLYQAFIASKKLKTIDKFILKDDGSQKFSSTFQDCSSLEDITIEGTIGQNGFDMQWSTKLSKASIESIINALSTTTSGLSITLSKTAVDNAFTAEEWAALIATRNNWTISLV